MIIDSHAHYAPQAIFESLVSGRVRFDGVACLRDGDSFRLSFGRRPPTRPVMANLREYEHRLTWMDGQAIDRQVVAPWTDSFGYEIGVTDGIAWSRFLNETLWRACEDERRLIPLATIPMQDGEAAAAMLTEVLDIGFKGVMIGTQPQGDAGVLDDPQLQPFWACAHERAAAIYIHPMFVAGDPRVVDYDMINAVGRLSDTTIAVARLLFSGHLLEYDRAQCILSHGGGALPFALGRLVRNVEAHPGHYADPAAGLARLHVDSCVFRPDALQFLVSLLGARRVMLGSDYPFPIGDPAPCAVVREARLTAGERDQILFASTARVLGLGDDGDG